jgi:hypothetical protein
MLFVLTPLLFAFVFFHAIKKQTSINQSMIKGGDNRPLSECNDTTVMYELRRNFERQRLLRILNSSQISDSKKIEEIENAIVLNEGKSKYATKITEGWLFKDWNF